MRDSNDNDTAAPPPRIMSNKESKETRLSTREKGRTVARNPISKKLRFSIFERDNFTCQYCGAKPGEYGLHVDHVIPLAGGGPSTADNLVTACEPCNSGKGSCVVPAAPLPDMSAMADAAESRAEAIARWRTANRQLQDEVEQAVEKIRREHYLDVAQANLENMVREYGAAEVDFAARRAKDKGLFRDHEQGPYMYGVLKNRRQEGRAIPEPVKRKGCPFDVGVCWTDQDRGLDGSRDGCLVRIDGERTCCTGLLNALDGWDDPELLERGSAFALAWRQGGESVLDFLRGGDCASS